MVHGMLGRDGALKLTRLKGAINSEKYIALLKDDVLTYIVNKGIEQINMSRLPDFDSRRLLFVASCAVWCGLL